MSEQDPAPSKEARLRHRVLSRWEGEGGAGPSGPQAPSGPAEHRDPAPRMGEAELAALHIRVVGVENLVIALLATASDEQLKLAREMAAYISPRPGYTQHPVTIRAADHLTDLIQRAERFRAGEADQGGSTDTGGRPKPGDGG